MGPFPITDRHELLRLVDGLFVPGVATVIEDVIVGFGDAVGITLFGDMVL